MRVAVIGPGRMGTLLSTACARAGHRLVAVAGGSATARHRVTTLVAGVREVDELADAVRLADLVVIAVPDDAIEGVVTRLVSADAVRDGHHVVHVSGSRGLGALRRAALAGARTAACHPAVSVPTSSTDPDLLVGVPWAVTAPASDLGWARTFVEDLGGDPHEVADDRRALYHAGLSLGSNAAGAAVVAARQLLLAAGIDDVASFLRPLAAGSVDNAAVAGAGALTGPIVRGDTGTLAAHLEAIDADVPALAGTYRSFATAVASVVGLPAMQADAEAVATTRSLLTSPRTVTTVPQVRAAIAEARRRGARIALVPTMGALHDGHLDLVRLAARHADVVVVSIFVNPTQFDRRDDLDAYPRDLAGDLTRLGALGDAVPELVFAPEVTELYPGEDATTVAVPAIGDRLEGAFRPGHFDGVATVVTKLFNIVQPDVAVFGRKDAQQCHVVRRLVDDLDLPIELVLAATVREPDGLALSSRNLRLSPSERSAALALSRSLADGVRAARAARDQGRAPTPQEVRAAAAATLDTATGVVVDYLEVVDPTSFAPAEALETGEHLLVVVAASVGDVRLIDNVEVGDLDDERRLLTATQPHAPA